MLIYGLSFLAGILTILAPCVLPVLPVILAGSLSKKQRREPAIIIASCVVSIVLFTLLLKVSTQFIGLDINILITVSGVLIALYGLSLLFPDQWARFASYFETSQKSGSIRSDGGFLKDILLGLSLGPIFTTCSPTYALILGVVFPVSFAQGLIATILYALGFAFMLGLIARGGRVYSSKLRAFADPYGWFKKVLGVILVLVGILIITGYIKKIESRAIDQGWYGALQFEQGLIDNNNLGN